MLRHCFKFVFGIAAGVAGIYYLKKLGDSEEQCQTLSGKEMVWDKGEKQDLSIELSSCTPS